MTSTDTALRRRAAETRQRFAKRYGHLTDPRTRYAAMKSVGVNSTDPLERTMARQLIKLYEAKASADRFRELASETDSVSEREALHRRAAEAIAGIDDILGDGGAAGLREAEREAIEYYRRSDEQASLREEAREIAAARSRADAAEALADRLGPATAGKVRSRFVQGPNNFLDGAP